MRKTAWEKRALVEQNQNQDPFENNQTLMGETLHAFDEDENQLLAELQSYVNEGLDNYDPSIVVAMIHTTARSFAKTATMLRETSTDLEEAKLLLTGFWQASDQHRFEFLNDILGKEQYLPAEADHYSELVEDLYNESDSFEQLEENIQSKYKMYLRTDSNILIGVLWDEEENEQDSQEIPEGMYEQGPDVLELVTELEKIAGMCDEEYRTGQNEHCSIVKTTREKGSNLTNIYSLDAQRTYYYNQEEHEETSTLFTLCSKSTYLYEGFDSLPGYVQEFLLELADDEEGPFDTDDLTDGISIFSLEFGYEIVANSSGSFQARPELVLYMNDEQLPIPDPTAINPAMMSLEEQTESTAEEQALFDTIFSKKELEQINKKAEKYESFATEDDIIEDFRQDKAEIETASLEQRIAFARGVAEELKRSIKGSVKG